MRYLLKIDGSDSPGIVAALTSPLTEADCNIHDTSMTRLAGHFAMLVMVEAPSDMTSEKLRSLLSDVVESHDLELSIEELQHLANPPSVAISGDVWALTFSGSERSGVVSAISNYLAGIGANIEDISTRMVGASSSEYAVLVDVVVPRTIPSDKFINELNELAGELGVFCEAHIVSSR